MNISLNTLKEFVSIGNINPEEIKNKLTQHTVEVEKIITEKNRFNNIVVAKILDIKKHPQADKLQIAILDDGQNNNISVVCGAPNIKIGQLVPLAKIGAILNNEIEIKEAEIRGEKSFGMLCSEKELNLGNNHEGIMILNEKSKIGENLSDYLSLNEIILEIDNKSMSNRPDLWGHYGIARELSTIFNKKLKKYESKELKIKAEKEKAENIKININAKNLCKKYLALKIDNIKIEESPLWLKNKLSALGLNSINNIVDITNYIMLELGQPLHAFDANNIKEIIIRKAEKNEKVKTIDEQEKNLNEEDLVIASPSEILAIAGIIGGKSSEINKATESIIIESANFDAVSVRKSAQKLNIRTESAMRFEKSLDPEMCLMAIKKAAEMIKKLCPRSKFKYELIEKGDYKTEEKIILLDLSWATKIIGQEIEKNKIINILESLGMETKEKNNDTLEISIPSWRQKDLNIKEDIIEEIIRIYGYNNIKLSMPLSEIIPPKKEQELELIKKIKKILSLGYKLNEVYNYSFVNEEQLLKLNLNPDNYLRIANPLSSQHSLLRQNISTNLVSNLKNNQSKYKKVSLFEIGNIFLNVSGEKNKDDKQIEKLPYQENRLAIILSEEQEDNFKNLKNICLNFLLEISKTLKIDFLATESIIEWADHEKRCLIMVNDKEVGFIAELEASVAKKNNLKRDASILEISLKNLLISISKTKKEEYQTIERFPSLNRDLAFVIDKKILYNNIKTEIENFDPLIKKVDLFDVYSGENLENNKKSMAFHITYQSTEKTLSGQEVDELQTRLISNLQEKFSAQIRDF